MIISLIISTIVVFFFFLFPVTDFDIWWHMAGGKFMIENWQFPYNDTFSYTATGQPWNPNSWGFTALSYLGYKAFGLDGLNIIKAIVSTLIFATVAGYLHWKKLLNYFSLMFVTLVFFAIRGGFSLRPHTLSYLIFIIFLILLWEYRERRSYKLIAVLALTQFIWVNFHASFIFGLVFSSIFIMSELLQNFIRTKNIKLGQKDIVLIISVFLASLIHVFYGYRYLVRIVGNYISPSAQLPIREALRSTVGTFISFEGLIVFAGLVLVGYFGFRKKEFWLPITALFLLAVTINTSRFIHNLMIFFALVLPFYFPLIKIELKKIRSLKIIKKKKVSIPRYIPETTFLVFIIVLFFIAKNSPLGIGLGLSKFSYPVKAVEFIQSEQLLEKSGGRLYNTYNFGGYLIWNNQPHGVAMDGRARPYLGDPFGRYWLNFEGGDVWEDTQKRYNVTTALMTIPHISGGTVYNTSTPMFPREEWALIYYDDVAIIYVKRLEELKKQIEKYEYSILDPQAMGFLYLQEYVDSQEAFDATIEEINRALSINPKSYRLHFTLAYVYGLAGLQEEMIEGLKRTLEINPHFQAAQNILEQLN